MSRFRRVVHSVASGYFVLVVAALYALAILPLGLHYLSTERLGLWTLMASISAYLAQIDLGMSSSLARLLIDHKDEREGENYGSLIQTGWLVLLVQGSIIAIVGFFLAPPLASMLKIDADLRFEFISLMRWMTASLAVSFFTKIFSHLLQAHQRMDLINYSQIINLALGFVLIWFFFHTGFGVIGLAWATMLNTLFGSCLLFFCCQKLRLLPKKGLWGKPSLPLFRDIFSYAKDIFLVSLGTQLIMASQPMIITRELGVATATLWYAGTRIFNLVCQAIWRISDVSMPAFAEMMVRGEKALLKERYKAVLVLTASFSAFAAISFVLCNSLFIWSWTSFSKAAPLVWPVQNDVLLGVWMIVLALLHCHNGLVLTTKEVGFMRYVYFVEGIVFVGAAIIACRWGGLAALIACSVACSVIFSGAYSVWRVSGYLELPVTDMALRCISRMAGVVVMFGTAAAFTWFLTRPVADRIVRLAIHAFICGTVGTGVFLRFGLAAPLRRELLQRFFPKS